MTGHFTNTHTDAGVYRVAPQLKSLFGGWWWLRVTLVLSFGLGQAEQYFVVNISEEVRTLITSYGYAMPRLC